MEGSSGGGGCRYWLRSSGKTMKEFRDSLSKEIAMMKVQRSDQSMEMAKNADDSKSKEMANQSQHPESESERAKEMKETQEIPERWRETDYDTSFRAPPRCRNPTKGQMAIDKKKRDEYVRKALRTFNKSKKAKKVGGYKLVEVKHYSPFFRAMEGFYYHANFKARPKNDPEAKPKTFFAELKYRCPGPVKCLKCCILGSHDFGTRGCKACERYFPKLRHPKDGFHIGPPAYLIPRRPSKKEECSS